MATSKVRKLKEVSTSNTFPFIYGYTDVDGIFHTDFSVREMTGSDEEAIHKSEIKTNGGKIIRTLIERCCTRIGTLNQEDFKPTEWREIVQDLDVAEQDRIVMAIREISVGKEIELKHNCPNEDCKQELVTYMDTDEIEIIPHNGVSVIDFELPRGYKTKDGEVLKVGHMRRPKGIDREILDTVARKNLGTANTLLLARCIVDLEGKQVNDQMVRDMSIKDRDHALEVLRDNAYGYDLQIELTCSHCGEQFTTTLNAINFI